MQLGSVGVGQRSAGSGVNAAVTLAFAYISNTQVDAAPLQSPDQPPNVWVASFQLAVRVTGALGVRGGSRWIDVAALARDNGQRVCRFQSGRRGWRGRGVIVAVAQVQPGELV